MTTDKNPWHQLVKDHCNHSDHPVIIVLGPTASGKTTFSIELAKFIGGEIINGDSRQLYKSLTIGTAKISDKEMKDVPHHLFDVLDPHTEATVGWYQKEAIAIIDSVHEKGSIPIVAGGSMLYLSALTDGLSLAPSVDQAVRDRLEKEYDVDRGVTLHKRLTNLDPETAARIHQNNKPRLVRAVEIFEVSTVDNPKGEMWKAQEESPYDYLILGIQKTREESVVKINNRCKAMFAAGWVQEVQALMDKGYTMDSPAMKSVGYKEIIEYLASGKQEPLEDLQERIAAKTRQYARRQMTWWKRDDRIYWIDV